MEERLARWSPRECGSSVEPGDPLEMAPLDAPVEEEDRHLIAYSGEEPRERARDQGKAVGLKISDRVHRVPDIAEGAAGHRDEPRVRRKEVVPVVRLVAERRRGPELRGKPQHHQCAADRDRGCARDDGREGPPPGEADHNEADGVDQHDERRAAAKPSEAAFDPPAPGPPAVGLLACQPDPHVPDVGAARGEMGAQDRPDHRYTVTPVALNIAVTSRPSRNSSCSTARSVTSATSGGRVPSATRTRSPLGGSGTSSMIGPTNAFCALPPGAVRNRVISRGCTMATTSAPPAPGSTADSSPPSFALRMRAI